MMFSIAVCIVTVFIIMYVLIDIFRIKKNDICKQLHELRLMQNNLKEQVDAANEIINQQQVQLCYQFNAIDDDIKRTIGNEMEGVRLRIDDTLDRDNRALDLQVDLKKIYKRLDKLEGRSDCKHSKQSDHKLFKSQIKAIEGIQSSFVEDINELAERIRLINDKIGSDKPGVEIKHEE